MLTGSGSINSSGLYTAPASAGSATVRAVAGGLTSQAAVTITNAVPSISSAAAAVVSSSTGLTAALSVLGTDDGGESALTYTWAATSIPTGASMPTFSANGNNSAKSTTATFSKAGAYTFACTISDGLLSVASSVNVTVSQLLTSITLTPGSASLALNATRSLSASALDQFGAVLASQPTFTWSVPSGGGSVSSAGLFTAPSSPTVATVTAVATGVTGAATMTVVNTAPTVASAAASVPGTVTGTTAALSALGADDAGESLLGYTWSVVSKPTGAADPTFSANASNAAKSVTATFSRAGAYTLACTMSDGLLSVASNVAVTVSQTLTTVAVSPGSVSLNERQTASLTALAFDQFAQALSSQPSFVWSVVSGGVGSVSGAGVYTAPASAGAATVRATVSGIFGSTAITVTNATPTFAQSASAAQATVTGVATTLSALGADDGGESALTYTWSVLSQPTGAEAIFTGSDGVNAAKNLQVSFNRAGNYVFRVVIDDGQGGTAYQDLPLTVAQTLTSIDVAPQSPSVGTGAQLPFVARPLDQFSTDLTSPGAITWTAQNGGSIDSSGVFTAGAQVAHATVTAASGGLSKSTDVFVGNVPPVVLAPVATPSTVTGVATNLAVSAVDDGGDAGLTYTWSVVSAPSGAPTPSFSGNGSNAAKNAVATFGRAGNYRLMVTVNDGALSATATVDLVVAQTLTAINVTPSTSTLSPGTSTLCAATAVDQFGTPLTSQPSFNWVVSAGVGTVSPLGLFAAGSGAGASTVTATAGGAVGFANVNVTTPSVSLPTINTTSFATVDPTTVVLGVDAVNPLNAALMTYAWTLRQAPAGAPAPDIAAGDSADESRMQFHAAGDYFFDVSVTNAAGTTTTTQLVTVNAVAHEVTLQATDGGQAPLTRGSQRQFTSSALDQFGQAYDGEPVAWSIDPGGFGTIDANGVYTAPLAGGAPSIVRATVGSRSAVMGVALVGRKGKAFKPAAVAVTRSYLTGSARFQANFAMLPAGTNADGMKVECKTDTGWETVGSISETSALLDIAGLTTGVKQTFRVTPTTANAPVGKAIKLVFKL